MLEIERIKLALSRADDSSIEIPAPAGLIYKGFQKATVEYSTKARHLLLGDEPGLGKTIQALAILNYKGHRKVIFFVPSSLVLNWIHEIDRWSLTFGEIEIYHPKTFKGDTDFLIVSYYWLSFKETLKDLIRRGHNDAHVWDEVHNLKTPTAAVTKLAFAPNGYFSLSKENICASGTPLENEPMAMFYLIRSIAPDVLGGMDRFSYGMKYCGGFQSPWGWDFSGASNLGELGKKLRSSVMVRRTKKQVLKDLPEKIIKVAYLAPNKALVSRMVLYEDLIIRKVISVEVTEISALRRDLGVSKIKDAVAYLETQLKGGRRKIVVFAHHKEVIIGLMSGLDKYCPLEISGRITSRTKRDENVKLFQDEKSPNRVIVCSIRAAGVGLTLTAADYLAMVEYDWVPGRNSQCFDRIHRIGQKNSVEVDILVYQDTLDERQLKVVLQKEANHETFYNDDERDDFDE